MTYTFLVGWKKLTNQNSLSNRMNLMMSTNSNYRKTQHGASKNGRCLSPRGTSLFFLLFVSFQQRLVCVYIWEGKFPSVSLCQTGVACGRVDDVVVWFFAPFSLQFSSSLSSCSPKLVGSESRTHVDDELCRVPTRESLVVCVELIAPEAPLRAIVNSVPLFQVSCSLFVLRVVLFCLFVK